MVSLESLVMSALLYLSVVAVQMAYMSDRCYHHHMARPVHYPQQQ